MGCKTSKVANTAEEIVARRREIKFTITWWKKKLKKQIDNDVKMEPILLGTPSVLGGEETPLYFRTEDSLLEVESISSSECLPDVRLDNCTPLNTPSPRNEKTNPSSPEKNTSTEDNLSRDDLEDDVSLTEYWAAASPTVPVRATRTLSVLPNDKTRKVKPTVLHNAWSEGSVPQKAPPPSRKVPTPSQSKLQSVFPKHLEEANAKKTKFDPTGRQRPKAAKGPRQAPDLTDVYRAELSIPGTPMEDPNRQKERQCLDAWMKRCLGDDAT